MSGRARGEPPNMPSCSLETLGAFAFRVDGRLAPNPSTQKARALLSYLAMHRGTTIARERLLELFWPDSEPERARDSLRTALHSIRRSVREAEGDPEAVISANKSTVCWTSETWLDADRFIELSEAGGDEPLFEALALYRGDFLEGDYDNWTVIERERIASRYESLLARALTKKREANIANKLLERNPYEEDAYATLIDTALADGRRMAAARLFKQCRAALEEIDAQPSAEFMQRYAKLEEQAEPAPALPPRLPFTGREGALAEWRALVDDARNGTGALAIVSGEPGIGKSAFLAQAADSVLTAGLRAMRINFLADDPRPFGPWGPLFESATGESFDLFASTASDAVVDAVLRTLIASLTAPSVFIADDAQYASSEAFALLGKTARFATQAGHVVLIATRPEGLGRLDASLGDAPRMDIGLERLTEAQLSEALQTLGFDDHLALSVALYKRTAGNPLFTQALLGSLVRNGFVGREGRRWALNAPLDADIALPKTLARVLEARVRSRGEAAAAVACALALEPDATADDLQAVLELEETTVLDALDDLLALNVITQPSAGPQFAFTHDLVREASASLLNVARRVRLHRAFAQRVERAGEADGAVRRARHLAAARDNVPAVAAYIAAAYDAMELNATSEALDRAQHALEILAKMGGDTATDLLRADVHGVMVRTLRRANLFVQAAEHAKAEVACVRPSGNRERLIRALLHWSSAQSDTGEIGGSAQAAEALDLARALGDDELLIRALTSNCLASDWLLDRDAALRLGHEAIEVALRHGNPLLVAASADALQRAQAAWWDFEGALRTLSLAQLDQAGPHWVVQAVGRAWRAHVYYFAGKLEEAQRELDAAHELAGSRTKAAAGDSDIGVSAIHYVIDGFEALVAIERGDWETPLRYATVRTRHPSLDDSFHTNYMIMVPLDALLRRDKEGDAERARDLIANLGERHYPPWVSSYSIPKALRARVAARMRQPGADRMVRDALDDAVHLAERCPADCFRAFDRLAAAAAEVGDMETAERAIDLRDTYLARHAYAVARIAQSARLDANPSAR